MKIKIECRYDTINRIGHLFQENTQITLCGKRRDGDVIKERHCYICCNCRDVREKIKKQTLYFLPQK